MLQKPTIQLWFDVSHLTTFIALGMNRVSTNFQYCSDDKQSRLKVEPVPYFRIVDL
jgi:hypothetical protein